MEAEGKAATLNDDEEEAAMDVAKRKTNNRRRQSSCLSLSKKDDDGALTMVSPCKGLKTGLKAFTNQLKYPTFSTKEDEFDYNDDDKDDFEEGLRLLQEKANDLGLHGQQANMVAYAKKNGAGPQNSGKMNNGENGQAGKKGGCGNGGGNSNQNMGMKGAMDQKNMAAAKMNAAPHLGGGHINAGEVKKGNDINAMLSGLNGHGHGFGVGLGGGQHPSTMMNNLQGYEFNHSPSSAVNL
ncbi:heavy metal-associated isoprenylated plant protein 33-like [Telopea speciosissima]|uniref:heavy metal-associated isoprenylated plant protein 33-like n=1 Tax=Telopea speciosissima TaxID=54955 RepID=UPI001CC4FAC0|nr:heavy metal-associated isoprenylated plant protein 33-like [Telopea speciosissima]